MICILPFRTLKINLNRNQACLINPQTLYSTSIFAWSLNWIISSHFMSNNNEKASLQRWNSLYIYVSIFPPMNKTMMIHFLIAAYSLLHRRACPMADKDDSRSRSRLVHILWLRRSSNFFLALTINYSDYRWHAVATLRLRDSSAVWFHFFSFM